MFHKTAIITTNLGRKLLKKFGNECFYRSIKKKALFLVSTQSIDSQDPAWNKNKHSSE